MKKAIKRLVRGDDGRLRLIYIDLATLQEVTDLTGYTVVSAGSASEEPEPVASVDQPDIPSETQPSRGMAEQGGGGGGALGGRRPSGGSISTPPLSTQTRQVTTPSVEQPTAGAPFPGRPDVTQIEVPEVIGSDGKKITDPKEIQQTVRDFVADNPEMAATELLSDRIIGGAKERGSEYAISGMDPELRNGLVKMIEAAPPEIGAGLQIHSGYRDLAHQTALYDASKGSGMVAKPTPGAPHVAGHGADLSWNGMSLVNAPPEVQNWVHENAPTFGLTFPMNDPNRHPFEPWHVETIAGRTGQPWTPPEATVPTPDPRSGGFIGGGMMLNPVGANLQPVSGAAMPATSRSDFPARPGFIGSLPAEDAQRGPFLARPEGIASPLPENAKGDRVGTGPFSAPSHPGVTPSFARPEFVGSLPMQEVGPFPARPGFAGALPAEDASRGPFVARPEYIGSLPESRFPSSGPVPQNREELSVAENIIQEARTPSGITKNTEMTPEQRRSFTDKTPAYFAANGLVDRTAEQISQIARTFSGELSPDQLRALAASDPVAQRELANMMVTLENRAASKFFDGSFDKALKGSYDSINKSFAIANTDMNYKIHGGAVENFVSDWYRGEYNDLVDNWNNSSYYNPDAANPSWGFAMNDPTMIGDHLFGSLGEYGPTSTWQSERTAFARGGTFGTSESPGIGRSSLGQSSSDGAYSQREGSGTFGTSSSPGVGRSSYGQAGGDSNSGAAGSGSFGGTSTGYGDTGQSGSPASTGSGGGRGSGGSRSGTSTSTSTGRTSAPSAGGYTGSPTNDGDGSSKTPGGGF